MFSPVAGTLTLRVPCDYIGYILKQFFRFEAKFWLVLHTSKSTASNVRKGRNGPHTFWLFEVCNRDAVSQAFHDHTTKEYYTVKPRSQKINLQKCLFIYNSGMDSLFHRSLILGGVFFGWLGIFFVV